MCISTFYFCFIFQLYEKIRYLQSCSGGRQDRVSNLFCATSHFSFLCFFFSLDLNLEFFIINFSSVFNVFRTLSATFISVFFSFLTYFANDFLFCFLRFLRIFSAFFLFSLWLCCFPKWCCSLRLPFCFVLDPSSFQGSSFCLSLLSLTNTVYFRMYRWPWNLSIILPTNND